MRSPTYNFVVDCPDETLSDYINNLDIEAPTAIAANPGIGWCLQTYLILHKTTQLPLTCSNQLQEGCINIIHSDQLLQFKGTASQFIVCVRGDYPLRRWAHFHIVQNKTQLGKNAAWVPFWITPGLIKRNPERRGVKRVVYAGHTTNGNLAGTENSWAELFKSKGIEFATVAKDSWHDLSAIDVLIGIRSFDAQTHNTKPPSKLINAWHANIPFIGGYDSAYLQVGKPGEDFLRVHTPQQALEAVLQLHENPSLYDKLVQNGSKKAANFTTASIAQTWETILCGPVIDRYEQWKAHQKYEQARFTIKLRMGVLEHQLKQVIKKVIGRK